ncbi:MAG: Crp/Fnr family transcriptional regulator [Sphingobacteriia bacterium]|nr:Crp/Fnr family transcriptional regulator [Sphingobacteriia bacterium]
MDNTYSIFTQLEPALREEIEKFSIIKTLKAGDTLIRTGQFIKSTMLVIEGKIKIFREGDNGEEFLLYYLQPGEACAVSMISASKTETSKIKATALEDTTVLMVPIQLMDEWMTKYKSWYYFVVESYRSRFEELLTLIDHIAFRNMDERLFFYLQKASEVNHSDTIHLSHQQIADELNSSREVISRLLKKMEQKGWVSLHRNVITLLKKDPL